MEKSIRVLVANHPRLMREIVLTTFADQPDIEIVGEVTDESEISESVKKTLPHFVVIALDQPGRRPPICDQLLRDHPEVRIIAVAPANNSIVYYWASLDIHSSDIEASEEGMLNVMRRKLVANGTN
jgi:chemotaxis response regulator CheB